MKTNILKPLILLFCLGGFITIEAQGLYNLATLDEEEERSPLKWSAGIDFSYDDTNSAFDQGVEWAKSSIGGSAGVGWGDVEGNSETSYCVGAEYLYRISGADQNPKGAGYATAFANYRKLSAENFDENTLRAGLGYTQFRRLTALNEVQLTYGIKGFFETGSQDFSGFEDDITGFGVYLFTGINLRLCDKASLGLEVPVASYLSRTFKSEGNEFDQDRIWAGVNKDNNVSATFRWHLGTGLKYGGKDTDGDGIWDKDDECPETPGLEVFF